jgi:hypothetical protein
MNDVTILSSGPRDFAMRYRSGLSAFCVVAILLLTSSMGFSAEQGDQQRSQVQEATEFLKQQSLATDDQSLVDFLRRQLPDADRQGAITKLIKQLNSDRFVEREAATAKLAKYGRDAKGPLTEAAKSEQREVANRAQQILQKIDSKSNVTQRQATLLAVIQVLGARKVPEAAPALLAIIGNVEDAISRDAAHEALWMSVDKSHAKLLRSALKDDSVTKQAAAIVGLEVAVGADAAGSIEAFLKSDVERLRLAAARALINHKPREVAQVLVELVASKDDEVSIMAEALLREQTSSRVEPQEKVTIAEAWQHWAKENLETAKLKKLGLERLSLTDRRNALVESFTRNAADVTKGYGRLSHEATIPSKARVVDGVLRLEEGRFEGGTGESDQRLAITSQKLIGRKEWPNRLEIQAKLGGEEAGSGGYHVGISVGKVKFIYHPLHSGGGFRVEGVDSHLYITSNEDMGFTPAAGALQEMKIKVRRTDTGATFKIEVAQDGETFTKSIDVTREQLGDFNRIGLERSGRNGGAALFDSVSIKLGR